MVTWNKVLEDEKDECVYSHSSTVIAKTGLNSSCSGSQKQDAGVNWTVFVTAGLMGEDVAE